MHKTMLSAGVLLLVFLLGAGASSTRAAPPAAFAPTIGVSSRNDTSPPLTSLAAAGGAAAARAAQPGPDGGAGDGAGHPALPLPRRAAAARRQSARPAAPVAPVAGPPMPATIVTFEGASNADNAAQTGLRPVPPDTNGDVGRNHYVQMTNLVLTIFDKSGTRLLGPIANNVLFANFGGPCETTNNGDPIVQYDNLADRWMLSWFALPNFPDGPFIQCIAVSATPSPLGAYHRYEFKISDTKLNDYPHFGVWPDAYYMSVNQFTDLGNEDEDADGAAAAIAPPPPPDPYAGQGAVAFERLKMLAGLPARLVYFDLEPVDLRFGGLLPSDLDGPPPPTGAPNYFVSVDGPLGGFDTHRLQLWAFHVDWSNPANSTFGLGGNPNQVINVAPFDQDLCGFATQCIPQPGVTPAAYLDAISDRLMYRVQYRNFGSYQTIVANHTVDMDGNDHAGIRWYELRGSGGGWSLRQQGDYAPDAANRWMGSAAMDNSGDIAVGYSVSSTTLFPSIRYAGRLRGDPPGQLPRGEGTIINGAGSQAVSARGAGRWGDYSMLALDLDGCTFWYTAEYYAFTDTELLVRGRNWQTRVGSFRFPECQPRRADLAIFSMTDSPDPTIVGRAVTYTIVVRNYGPDASSGPATLTVTVPAAVAVPAECTPGASGSVCTFTVDPLNKDQTQTFTLTVTPTAPGSLTVTATVEGGPDVDPNTGNNSRGETTRVNPPPAPAIAFLNGSTVQFGRVTIGNCGTQSVNIRNSGNATLAVGSASIAGDNAADFTITNGAGPITLAPQQTYAFLVKFCPSATGARGATLLLSGGNVPGGSASVGLAGTGATR